jgi:phosphopantothenoylcysteine decarboxylase/phosphopantothenate--cysteine ligase
MRVLLGVTGGIAAYKAADLTSQLIKAGHEVRVIMTPSATRFVGPITFEGLCGYPVFVDVLANGAGPEGSSAVQHISWARWAEVVMIAPLTASTMAKLAHGICDNALLTVVLAVEPDVPVYLAPAMNTQMWLHPLTQRNVGLLNDTGRFTFVAPVYKRLACGEVGAGGLADVADLLAAVHEAQPSV